MDGSQCFFFVLEDGKQPKERMGKDGKRMGKGCERKEKEGKERSMRKKARKWKEGKW